MPDLTLDQKIAQKVARKMFVDRGNHSEIYLSEQALRDTIAVALELQRRLLAEALAAYGYTES